MSIIKTLGAIALVLTVASCREGKSYNQLQHETRGNRSKPELIRSGADSLVEAAWLAKDYERTLALADSLEQAGQISAVCANYHRGMAYSSEGKLRTAESCWQKNMTKRQLSEADLPDYYQSAAALSGLLANKRNYEGALRVALPAVTKMEDTGSDMDLVHALLHESIGRCQLNLRRDEEALESYDLAFTKYKQAAEKDSTAEGVRHAIVAAFNTALSYLHARHFKEARVWTIRTDSLITPYLNMPDASKPFADHVLSRLKLQNAVALQGMGKTTEAAEAFRKYEQTEYGQSDYGRIDATSYLVAARRYAEAADNYRDLDRVLNEWGMEYSLENIQGFLFPKYRANMGAGRKDSALAVAMRTFEVLDSAIERAKMSDAAELATVYETQQKETEIARQQADLSRQRWVGTLAASVLLTAFFIFYIFYRSRSQRKLAAAHDRLQDTFEELQTAYDQLQKTTEAKEKMESELRIARDIQLSMVPSVFPERDDLDLYASMVAAKHVGGDLYDYVLLGNHLYFCVGDVAGKGVPASLVMAQTIRLFRSLATQEHLPCQIAQRINTEMTTNAVAHGMFVTMFIGLLDMTTGRLQFCNAGHNPPVLGGDAAGGTFLEMESNAPVGLWEELQFVGEEIENIKGRPLFVYSDGLTEAENPDLEQFGENRLLESLHHIHFESSRQVIERLTQEVERHRNGAEPNDDMTMLCLKLQ